MPTHTSQGDEDRLYVILVNLTGRRLSMAEVYRSVGLSRQQYSEARSNGTLIIPNRMVLAAGHLGINPVELLTECGILTLRDAAEYVDARRREAADLFEHPMIQADRGVNNSAAGKSATEVVKTGKRDEAISYDPDAHTL